MKNLTGPILPNYEEKELIASGSFSWVYRCLNQEEGSLCAIKIAKPSELCRKAVRQAANRRNALVYRTQLFEWGSEFLYETSLAPDFAPSDLLRRQAAILSACNDSSLVKFIESGVAEDQAYLCMDYLAGPTLRELLRCGKASIQTLIDVLEGLGRLYGSTSFQYHGDLKPENIIVTAAGAKMIDPGIFSGGALVTTQAYYPTLSPVDLVAVAPCSGRSSSTVSRSLHGYGAVRIETWVRVWLDLRTWVIGGTSTTTAPTCINRSGDRRSSSQASRRSSKPFC
jgi:serine/threonine protein kinase